MTAVNPAIRAWAARPVGKALRIALATLGSVAAFLVLMTAAVAPSGTWALVLAGVGLAAGAVRTALVPTAAKLTLLAMALIAVPVVIGSL